MNIYVNIIFLLIYIEFEVYKIQKMILMNLVWQSAVAAIPEPEFLVSLLLSVKQFSFSKSVQV